MSYGSNLATAGVIRVDSMDELMSVHLGTVILDEKVKQIPKMVEATKKINEGRLEVMKDLVSMAKQFEMKDLLQAMIANNLLGAGDLAALGRFM